MGRTLLSFRPALEVEIDSWKEYRRGLRLEDRIYYDHITNFARQHADAGSLAGRPMLSEILFFSAALEQQKLLEKLESLIISLSKKVQDLELSIEDLKKKPVLNKNE